MKKTDPGYRESMDVECPDPDPGPGRGNVMKCFRCRGPAFIKLSSHNANFCPDCFDGYFVKAVEKAFKWMPVPKEAPVVVAVSGGKDSLVLWDVLVRLGFRTEGLHLDLGLGEFSAASREAIDSFCRPRGSTLRHRAPPRPFRPGPSGNQRTVHQRNLFLMRSDQTPLSGSADPGDGRSALGHRASPG